MEMFSLGTPVSTTNKTDCHDITEILFRVALNTIALTYLHGVRFFMDFINHTYLEDQLRTKTVTFIVLFVASCHRNRLKFSID